MIARRWVIALAAVLSLGGCEAGGSVPVSGEPYRPPPLLELLEKARAALSRYDDAVSGSVGSRSFVPVGSLTDTVGELDGDNAGRLKQALVAGLLVPAVTLPDAPDGPGRIVWADGVSRSVAVISAQEALVAHRRQTSDDCGCAPLHVTGVRSATMQIVTTTGTAAVPAWEYTLRETAVKVTYAAVGSSDTVTVPSPPAGPDDSPGGETLGAVITAGNGRELTVSFTGASGPANEPCGADYHAEAVESSRAVVVIVIAERLHADGNEICTLGGFTRTETVPLSRSLAGRAVLDGRTGQPVGVTVDG